MLSFLVGILCGLWVLALAGTGLLNQAINLRLLPHRDFVASSVVERPWVGWLIEVGRALGEPRQWQWGLRYALRLLTGHDGMATMSEESVEAVWRACAGEEPRDGGGPAGEPSESRDQRRPRRNR